MAFRPVAQEFEPNNWLAILDCSYNTLSACPFNLMIQCYMGSHIIHTKHFLVTIQHVWYGVYVVQVNEM